jgi:hypothetical protein
MFGSGCVNEQCGRADRERDLFRHKSLPKTLGYFVLPAVADLRVRRGRRDGGPHHVAAYGLFALPWLILGCADGLPALMDQERQLAKPRALAFDVFGTVVD